MKILSISHYDLDGFGCQLSIKEKFKNHNIEFENTSYGKIEKALNNYDFNNFDLIFITDLNFNDDQQKLLYKKLKNFNGNAIYIDHHQYETTEWLDKANLKVIIDTSKSATLKTFEILRLDNPNLKKLCEIIDIFDVWRKENSKFKFASYFNSWFWENVETFMYKMEKINYDISKIKNEIKDQKKKVDQYFKENLNKTIFYEDPIFISFEYKYINHIEEIFKGLKFAIILNIEQNRISIRDHILIKEKVQELAKKYNGDCGGHIEAYGMVIPNLEEKYQQIIKDLVDLVKKSI